MTFDIRELGEGGDDVQNINTEDFCKLPYDKVDDKASMEKVHKWLINDKEALQSANRDRFDKLRRNMALNKGILYKDDDNQRNGDRDQYKPKKYTKMVINTLKEANRIRASRILKYKPAVAILPTNDELADKVAAETCENIVAHIWYEQRFDGEKLPELARSKGIVGEMYLFVEWDPNLGDIHKEYKKAEAYQKKNNEDATKERMEKVPLLGESGEPEVDDEGQIIWVEKPVKNGDVRYSVEYPMDVLWDRHPSKKLENSRWLHKREIVPVEEARIRYPDHADLIKGDKDIQFYDYEECKAYSDQNCVELWHFYLKRSETVADGRYIVYSADGIVSNKKFPYSHKWLPAIRWADIFNPKEMHASPFFDDVKGINKAFNDVNNMILRNEYLVGHPKWMLPAGSADIKDLGNGITIVQFKGAVAPQLVQANPTGQGAYNLRGILKDEVSQNSDVSRTGNGEPPKGVTAAVAIQYLSELEAERWNEPTLIHNEATVQLTRMTLAVAQDYYDPSDERMIRVQGQENEWQTEFIDAAVLAKDYDVRVQNASSLPETKSARLETLLTLAKQFPQDVEATQILDMFEFAQSKKYIKEGTISIRAAEAENEMMMGNKAIPAPEEYEDQIMHWKTHVRQMRQWQFKNRSPKEVQDKVKDHLMAHEMLMVAIAVNDANFAQKLTLLEGFPMFYEPSDTGKNEDTGTTPPPEPIVQTEPLQTGPMAPEVQEPVQQPGAQVNEEVPNIPEQQGLETSPQEPTHST